MPLCNSPDFDTIAPTTTKGDLVVRDATTNVREPVGADTFVLTADSAQASGIKWAAANGAVDFADENNIMAILAFS